MTDFNSRYAELQELTEGSDLSLATRRAMDLFDEYDALHHLRHDAMRIRADYNMTRELGSSELTEEVGGAIRERLKDLLDQAADAPIEEQYVPDDAVPSFIAQSLSKPYYYGWPCNANCRSRWAIFPLFIATD